MPTQPCQVQSSGSQIVAQTLFLGASVNSYNTSMGWGSQPSQLTVTLVEDAAVCYENGKVMPQMDTKGTFEDDHYHTCTNDACYVNSKGDAFSSSSMDISERMVPGKVYYEFGAGENPSSSSKCFKSKYWYDPDPGFFGKPNRIKTDNSYDDAENAILNRGYDIIDTPVLFKMGNFSFGGLVQSWNEQQGQGGKIFNVTINSMQTLLNSCYIILGSYAGAVYSKLSGSTPGALAASNNSIYGGPRNYTGRNVEYFGKIYEGNMPNVFNVYGFLESFGKDGFGGAKITSEGIPANNIIDALTVLTSSTGSNLGYLSNNSSFIEYGPRLAFSPFGRILSKCMQENDTYKQIDSAFNRFGVIPPSIITQEGGSDKTPRCSFMLDLSEIPRFPNEFRIAGPVINITEFLQILGETAGFDYYVELIPAYNTCDSKIEYIIKVKTISRLAQPRLYEIQSTINELKCNNYALSSVTIGKEKNESAARSMIIGGPVQRLYQAKSYRLAYTQSNFIFDPHDKKFIDYLQLGSIGWDNNRSSLPGTYKQFHHGKTKLPAALDQHNPKLSQIINPSYSGLYDHNDAIKAQIPSINFQFTDKDDVWSDNDQLQTSITGKSTGNYGKAKVIKASSTDQATWGTQATERFFPLFKDVICPFFGFVMDTTTDIKTDGSNNDFRRIRPVWFDTWTGQIVILLGVSELPQTSVNLTNTFNIAGVSYFVLTESEIRAALAGFDEFLVYCLSKNFKTQLVEMLRRAYILRAIDRYKFSGANNEDAVALANKKHDWYWRMVGSTIETPGSNIAGPFNLTVPPSPDRFENNFSIDPEALRDLQIIHEFVAQIGQYYGKKYMVMAPYLTAYRDDEFSNIVLPTDAGSAYVFGGGGELHYSYEPTQEGAWEEYGNIIDDCIVVGGKEWYNLTDDLGKIKPILGYNANDAYDLAAHKACLMSQSNLDQFQKDSNRVNPFWSFETWEMIKDLRDQNCASGNYLYSPLNYAGLNSDEYVLVSVSGAPGTLPSIYNQFGVTDNITPFTPFTYGSWTAGKSKDAFGTDLPSPGGGNPGIKKLFVTTDIDSKFAFLYPESLSEPRILINSPGLTLNSSSNAYAQDPNSVIVANVAIEDLCIYLRSTHPDNRDTRWINCMLSYVYTVLDDPVFLTTVGLGSANKSASYASLHPKAAHPFFAGIPIRSNVYSYGPWINHPHIDYLYNSEAVLPSGTFVKIVEASGTVSCSGESIGISTDQAKNAFNNWILPTNVEIMEDYVPWNYGGMAFLDSVAINDSRSRTNYQNILETAQIDMPGLPLFNLGGSFTYDNILSAGPVTSGVPYIYTDDKYDTSINSTLTALSAYGMPSVFAPFAPSGVTETITYTGLQIISSPNNFGGPVVTNIQVNSSQGGIITTYSFRTYSKKLSLFNKENSDNIKQMHLNNIRRNKQLSKISNQFTNNLISQNKIIQQKKLSNINFSNKEFNSKLFGWSPAKVLIGQASPYINKLKKSPDSNALVSQGYAGSGSGITQRTNDKPTGFKISYTNDIGDNNLVWHNETDYLTDNLTLPSLASTIRYRTDVGLFEEKEVNAQISQDYGMQSIMSLDGVFSPVSFYPTFKNSTFHFGLYNTSGCPFCTGSKKIQAQYLKYTDTGYGGTGTIDLYCNKCTNKNLKGTLKSNTTSSSAGQSIETLPPYIITSGTDISVLSQYTTNQTTTITTTSSSSSTGAAGVNIPINMISLQPIVVPYGEFSNPNVQSYSGVHPDGSGIHTDLSFGAFTSAKPRTFFDRCRHSIEVVGRGFVKPESLNISNNLKTSLSVNADYYNIDIRYKQETKNRGFNQNIDYQNNQRFLGLRGPLVLHGWGYDLEGYPVPNAADEPYEIDSFNRPRRFKVKIKSGYPKTVEYKTLKEGDIYTSIIGNSYGSTYYSVGVNDMQNVTLSTQVGEVVYEDDMENGGGFGAPNSNSITDGYQGTIIGKTQQWTQNGQSASSNPAVGAIGGKWSSKKKLKQFYLNWAERPDMWPVGPIDLRWDADRKVWATKSDAGSIYKMVYVTLEEDLVKDDDVEETYPARGFLDDLEYSAQPLDLGLRRLVFVKDRAGYTAPRGAKLLCRYDTSTGFYEPVSKQIFVAKGSITPGSNTATIEMSYAPGKKRGEAYPTMMINFENLFDLPTTDNKGLFTFINSKWVLTTSK